MRCAQPGDGRPSIAAVIPAHNRELLIERAIASVLAQERPADEIVVVDDGSSDRTATVVEGYGDHVKLIRQPQSGVSVARNTGVEQSSCDFIAFLDSDDIWNASHLRRMDDAIVATGGEAVVYFSDLRTAQDRLGATYWELAGMSIGGRYELRQDPTEWFFGAVQPMHVDSTVIRREVYLAVKGSDPKLIRRGDTHLFFKLGLAGAVCAVAGLAGEQTRDDAESIVMKIPTDHESYIDCTIMLYRDLLRAPDLTRAQRSVLAQRLADGYWERVKQKAGKAPLDALLNVGRAMRRDPAIVPKRVSSRMRRVGPALTRRVADDTAK